MPGPRFTHPRRRVISAARRITDVTRRRLIEGLAEIGTVWSGVLDEVEFLRRLYDLDALPSDDPRFSSAGRDVFQHRVLNPADWDDDWIFYDTRFGLTDSDDALLRFLAEMLHPYIRTDLAEVEQLRTFLNSVLIHDGYEIAQIGEISGAPVFTGRRIGSGVRGSMKNLIFAAIGPKPEIVLDDALNNDLRIVKNEQNCLVYDRPLAAHGLTWSELTTWWADGEKLTGQPERAVSRSLHQRLLASIDVENGAERRIFAAYGRRYAAHGADIPALLPQAHPPNGPRITGATGDKRFSGPLVRPGRCPLYVRAQLETAEPSWTQRDLIRPKTPARDAEKAQATGHFRR